MTDLKPGLCLDFANTNAAARKGDGEDRLASPADLVAWLESNGAGGRALRRALRTDPSLANRLLARAKRLREATYRAMSAIADGRSASDEDIDAVSKEARAARAAFKLVRDEEAYKWELWTDEPESTLALIAISAAELLTGPDLHRVRECGNETCGWLFLDNSKNQSRKWCDMSDCGNKMKARRHYAKMKKAKKRSS
jgi:predicted RNA-binding Zn ribbon-like protein